MSDKKEALRWIVFTRLMEKYNSDFLGDETIMKRIEEAVDKAEKELETREEVVIEIPFIATAAEGSPQGPMHFREVIKREDLTPLLDEEPWLEEHEVEDREEQGDEYGTIVSPQIGQMGAGRPPPLGPESSSAGFFILLAILTAVITAFLVFLR